MKEITIGGEISDSREDRHMDTHVDHLDISCRCLLLAVLTVEDGPPASQCQKVSLVEELRCAPVLVKLDGGNHHIAWVDTDGCCRAVRLVPLDTVDVDDPLLAVHLCDLALPTLVLAPNDPDLIILANG